MIADFVADIQNNPDWITYGLVFIGILSLLVVGLYISRRSKSLADALGDAARLQAQVSDLDAKATETGQQLVELREELVHFQAKQVQWQSDYKELTEARETLATQKAQIASLKTALDHHQESAGTLKEQFTALANEVMRAQSADFKKSSTEQLKTVLQPLREHIGHFEKELRDVHKHADKDRAALKAEISNLTARSLQVSEEAHNLTQALKGDSQKQGAWGEMVLASILDRSGLREGEEYITQAHHRNEDGKSLRPDVVVNLPGGGRLVIDSKVSLTAYERAVNAENEAAANTSMQAHVLSVRTHIDTLAAKEYHKLDDGTVDYVIMFMPIESAFSEAVRAQDDLALYASDRNVVIASPTNLMVTLKTVQNLWSVERRNKNALKIADRAGMLYDKFHGFTEDMKKIGVQLNTVQKTHDAAMGKLSTGRGNLVRQAEELKTLGARASKQLDVEHEADEIEPLLQSPDEGS